MSEWTATVQGEPAFQGAQQRVTVLYSDGVTKYSTPFFASDADDLARQVKRTIAGIENAKTTAKPIQAGATIDLTPDAPPPPPDPPTAEQVRYAAVVAALRDVRIARNALLLNVGTQKALDEALGVFQALYVADTDRLLIGGIV